MGQASSAGHVNLAIRRRVLVQDTNPTKTPLPYYSANEKQQPYDVIVTRRENEGFGFIIVSSVNRVGAVVGRIIESSPAERCGMLRVGDRIIAVNDVDISRMLHEDIVNLIKDSGYSVKLVVAPPTPAANDKRPNGSMTSATALPTMSANETLVRNMNSHTATGTADRYNGGPSVGPPLQNSKSAGNLATNIHGSQSQPFGSRSESRLPSSSSGTAPAYNDYTKPTYQPPARPQSAYEPTRNTAYNSPQKSGYDASPRQQAYETPIPTYDPPKPGYEPPKYEPSRGAYEPPRPNYEPPKPGYDPSKLGIRTPLVTPSARPTGSMPNSQTAQPSPGSILNIELLRSSRGFGFSIRGGREFNNMPLYVLRIAEEGAAYMDQRLLVGDEILEINDQPTNGMSHAEAINLIQSGGSKVKLLIRRTGQLPNIVSEQGMPSPQGSGLSSPAIRNGVPSNNTSSTNQVPPAYEINQNYNKDRYGVPSRQDSQVDGKYNPVPAGGYNRPELTRADSNRSGLGRGMSINRGGDIRPGYEADRYNTTQTAPNSRYGEQRGYPVGRDNMPAGNRPTPQIDRQTSNPYPPSQQSNHPRPYNNSIVSKPPPQYNAPTSMSSPYPQQAPANTTQYNNNSKTPVSYQPNHQSYPNNNMGQRPPPPTGSYNAGAMNRQTNQQMYNYYDSSKPSPSQVSERQPPIGQNSFDNRSSAPQPNYSTSYNARHSAPSAYKAMDYGPQGMIRGSSSSVASNPRTMYSGQGAPVRPPYNNNYNNDQHLGNNYYSRQPAYQ